MFLPLGLDHTNLWCEGLKVIYPTSRFLAFQRSFNTIILNFDSRLWKSSVWTVKCPFFCFVLIFKTTENAGRQFCFEFSEKSGLACAQFRETESFSWHSPLINQKQTKTKSVKTSLVVFNIPDPKLSSVLLLFTSIFIHGVEIPGLYCLQNFREIKVG